MKLRSAIHSHVTWLIDLVDAVIDKRSLDAAAIDRDDACEIGKWIHGEGGRYESIPEFRSLREIHAAFHACAGAAVRLAEDGKRDLALERLDQDGACDLLSQELLEAFCSFHSVLRDQGENSEDVRLGAGGRYYSLPADPQRHGSGSSRH